MIYFIADTRNRHYWTIKFINYCFKFFIDIINLRLKIGEKITSKEKEERKLYDKKQLIAGLKEITALFEEADGLWINLQGKDRKERLEKNKKTQRNKTKD